MPTVKSYDQKCLDLACAFLSDEPALDNASCRHSLALEIQQCIEDEIFFMRNDATTPRSHQGWGRTMKPSPQEIEALAGRCESATVADRELDKSITEMLHPGEPLQWPDQYKAPSEHWQKRTIPFYSFSIDAAMTLIPARALWSVCDMEEGPFAQVIRPMPNGGYVGGLTTGKAATPALALCAAALRALSATQQSERT